MNQVVEDVKRTILEHPHCEDIRRGGGVEVIDDIDNWSVQNATPAVALVDRGTTDVSNLSSYVVRVTYRVEVHVIQQTFDKEGVQVGTLTSRSIGELATAVRKVLNNNRMGGKYMLVNYVAEEQPLPIKDGNIYLQRKLLLFELVRVESP